jgi:hypothetical protein
LLHWRFAHPLKAAAEFGSEANGRRGVFYEALGGDDWFISQYVVAE